MFKAYLRNNKMVVKGRPSLIELEERLRNKNKNKHQNQMPSLVIQATYTE